MYVGYPYKHVAALEAETGKLLWEFTARGSNHATTELRSLAYWPGDKQTPPQILFGNGYDGDLYSLNAKTGKPNPGL